MPKMIWDGKLDLKTLEFLKGGTLKISKRLL